MSFLKNKKLFCKKLLFCSSLSFAAVSSMVAVSVWNNSSKKDVQKNTENVNSSTSITSDSTSTTSYDHTNYFSIPSSMPTDFNGYDLFAQTRNSSFVQISTGVLGISKDETTFYLTTYSGRIVWAQQFSSNDLVKKFYKSKNWNISDISKLTIKEWAFLNAPTKTLAVLLGDDSHQFVTVISLDSGLFLSSDNTASNYQLNINNIFQDLNSTSYTNISRVGTSGFLVWQNNGLSNLKYYKVSTNSITLLTSSTSSINSTFSNKKILSFISSSNHLYALYVDGNSSSTKGPKHKYKQYISQITIANNGNFSSGDAKPLNDYICDSSSLDTSTFVNRAIVSDETGSGKLIFLDGSNTHNSLNVYSYDTNGALTENKTLSFDGYTIASITKNSRNNRVYIANNNSSIGNVYLGYVDTAQSTLTFSSIRQSTQNTSKNYFLVPVLSYASTEYFVLQDNDKNKLSYMSYSNGNYSIVDSNITLKTWTYKPVDGKSLWEAFGKNYLPKSFSWNTVSNYFDSSKMSCTPTFEALQRDDNNGTISFWITFQYTSAFSSTFNEMFRVYFHINNLYDLSSNFSFSWLDSNNATKVSTNEDKIKKIADLKKSKYANQITAKDIIDNFISYTIKKKDDTNLVIDESMVSLSYSSSENLDTLTVKITIPTDDMPNGFRNIDQHILTNTYTGFMSLQKYLVSPKSTSDVSSFEQSIFPSKLTYQDVIEKFLDLGSGLDKNESSWEVNITDVDDLLGSAKISVSLKNTSHIPNFDGLPQEVKNNYSNIVHEVTYTGFKSIETSGDLSEKPVMTNYSDSYLPSELWGQYKAFLKGEIHEQDVILLKNLSFSLINKSDLSINCLNENTCDADGYLDLEFSIKDNSVIGINYNGTQFKNSDGKLIFDKKFLENSGVSYPYRSKWNICANNKHFYIVNKNNGSKIDSVNNEYKINVKSDSPFTSSFSNDFSSVVTENDIEKLIDTEGYNYTISLQSNVDDGYTVATINLSLKNPPLYEEDVANNANFTRTIYIYNFKVPFSLIAKVMLLVTIVATGFSLTILSIWFVLWKLKLVNYRNKSHRWDVREKQKMIKNHMHKKNRFIKNESAIEEEN